MGVSRNILTVVEAVACILQLLSICLLVIHFLLWDGGGICKIIVGKLTVVLDVCIRDYTRNHELYT